MDFNIQGVLFQSAGGNNVLTGYVLNKVISVFPFRQSSGNYFCARFAEMERELNIPLLDLAWFRSGDEKLRKAFVTELGRAYEEVGFVAIRNHGLSDVLRDELYAQVQSFFALPDEIKEKYEIDGLAGQRGYTSFGKEHAKDSEKPDLKEFWHFGQEIRQANPSAFDYPANVWVDELPEFNKVGMEAFRALEDTGLEMLRAIALYLGLNEDFFDNGVFNGNSILRPIHYAPITSEPKGAVRAGQHEDINLITLLMGASAEGLEILNKKSEWVAVTALPEHLVVNVGDMLQRLTNNRLRSTTHRVVNPPKERWSDPRYSIPFFLHPTSEFPLDCLPSCVNDQHPRAYEDISAGKFLEERLREIGLLK